MCGIFGIFNRDRQDRVNRALLQKMGSTVRHRGPDDTGIYISEEHPNLGLGHCRLSIIDVEGSHQPLSNEDGCIWIVQNGEIYNFRELRKGLIARGHKFRTGGDAEVIVHLYEELGTGCLEKLRGMFAFALWDDTKGTLFLARDRLGQKPLVYCQDRRGFYFASEIKSILEIPGIPRKVDEIALHHYLTYQYVPHPWSMFEGIKKVPPAHFVVVREGRAEVRRYWQLDPDRELRLPFKAYMEKLRELLEEATALRLISDVPLGAFLSGGIDSTITVGLMSKLSPGRVKTFSIDFKEKQFSEVNYARLAARKFNTDHRELTVTPEYLEVLPKLIWHYNEPFADSSMLPTYYISKLTREYVKVALTGDAGDECFAGYPRYKAAKIAGFFDMLPRPVRHLLTHPIWQKLPASTKYKSFTRRLKRLTQALDMPPERRYLRWICYFDDLGKQELYLPGLARRLEGVESVEVLMQHYRTASSRDFLTQTTYVDLMTYLPDDLLVKVDIASMANSLEARSPFLDHKLVEFALGIPMSLKLAGFRSKHILKRTFRELLPRRISHRPKMGFGVPIARWLRTELKDYARDLLTDRSAGNRDYFRPEAVRKLLDEHIQGVMDHGYRLWALLCFELWYRTFIS